MSAGLGPLYCNDIYTRCGGYTRLGDSLDLRIQEDPGGVGITDERRRVVERVRNKRHSLLDGNSRQLGQARSRGYEADAERLVRRCSHGVDLLAQPPSAVDRRAHRARQTMRPLQLAPLPPIPPSAR